MDGDRVTHRRIATENLRFCPQPRHHTTPAPSTTKSILHILITCRLFLFSLLTETLKLLIERVGWGPLQLVQPRPPGSVEMRSTAYKQI